MTEVMNNLDPIFNLSSPEAIIGSKYYEYNRYYEQNGDVSMNNDELTFTIRDRESYLHLQNAYLLIKVRLRAGATPANAVINGNQAFPVGVSNVFRRASFSIEGNVLEDTSPSADMNHIINLGILTDFELDYLQANGYLYGMVKDYSTGLLTGTEATSDPAMILKSKCHKADPAAANGNYNYFVLPLSFIFGSHRDWDKVWTGVSFEYKFYKQSAKMAIVASVDGDWSYDLDRVHLYIPRVEPSAEAAIALNEQMANSSTLMKWRDRKIYRSAQLAGDTAINWRVVSTSYKPTRIWIFAQDSTTRSETDNTDNKFHYDSLSFKRLRVNINGVQYPKLELVNNDGRDFSRQLSYIYQAGGKTFDVRSSSCVNLQDLLFNQFNFYCIPLDVPNEVFKTGTSTDIFVEIDKDASPNNWNLFAIVESDRETQINFTGGKITSIV